MENPQGDPQLEIVAQRWPNITLSEATLVLAALANPLQATKILTYSGRPTSAGSLIETPDGNVFLKRYSTKVRDADTILPYHRFTHHLAANKIETPVFLPFQPNPQATKARLSAHSDLADDDHDYNNHHDHDNYSNHNNYITTQNLDEVSGQDTVLTVGDFVYEVSPSAPGEDRYVEALSWDPPASVEEAKQLGKLFAKIAKAADSFQHPQPKLNPFSNRFELFANPNLDQALSNWLQNRPGVFNYLQQTNRNLFQDLSSHRNYACRVAKHYSSLPKCWNHGDPHISNLTWIEYQPVSVFDFGNAAENTALFELVMALERQTIQWVQIMNGDANAYRLDLAQAILSGYNSIYSLSDLEKTLILDLLPICQAEASLNWISYYMEGTGRVEDANWCYDTGLLAHTNWFNTSPGQEYLHGLESLIDKL